MHSGFRTENSFRTGTACSMRLHPTTARADGLDQVPCGWSWLDATSSSQRAIYLPRLAGRQIRLTGRTYTLSELHHTRLAVDIANF